ncbi:MAG: FlgD immunoglobulin-like domain containing protein [Gaiellaceae bacterium]
MEKARKSETPERDGRLRRMTVRVLVIALLGGTAVAFVSTQRLKLERSPVTGPRFDRIFSPTCRCETDTAQLSFRLRRSDRVDAVLVDGKGERVRTLASDLPRPRGSVTFLWNGRNEGGEVVPDGRYRVRVHLRQSRRTIMIPTTVKVDTEPPVLRILRTTEPILSPDGDHRRDRFSILYRLGEQARPVLMVDGKRASAGRLTPPGRARFDWHGRIDGRPQRPGSYLLSLRAVDRAGNSSPPSEPVLVRLRFVAIVGVPLTGPRGGTIRLRVDTDAEAFRWSISRRGKLLLAGRSPPPRAVIQLPARLRPGRYRVEAQTAFGAGDRATLIIRRVRQARRT